MSDEIINTRDQCIKAGGDRIAIFWHGPNAITGSRTWLVSRFKNGRELITDPKAAWYHRGKKAFLGFMNGGKDHHECKAIALAEAEAWIAKTYGKREFVRNRMGDMVEHEVNEKFPLRPRPRPRKGSA